MKGPKMPAKKYFIAIIPPPPLFVEIEGIKNELFEKYALRGALRSPAHITLHRPFEWKTEKENALIETLKKFETESSFEITLKNFSFFEPRVIFVDVVPSSALQALHRRFKQFVQTQLHLLNEINDLRGFHPHVTVAFRDLKKALFYQLKEDFLNREFHQSFVFGGLTLLRLEKKWEIIHRFCLPEAAG